MQPVRVERATAQVADLMGRVLCHELRSDDGRVAISKGRVLDAADSERAFNLAWSELHLVALDPNDVHEDDAGVRIARLVAGRGVSIRTPVGGHWPIASDHRGLLAVDVTRLERVNSLDGPCIYSVYDGQVVEAGEVVARAKIIPFAVSNVVMESVESILAEPPGLIRVQEFKPHRVAAVVHESMGERAVARFRAAVSEKIGWFGSSLCAVAVTPSRGDAIASAVSEVTSGGADIVLVAGAKAMDMLDPTFAALDRIGARMIGHGVPAHPGSLLWLAEWDEIPIVGMPTCGLFSQATVFDLVVSRLLTGERMGRRELARLGHGGFLTRAMAFRLPAYRETGERGAVD